MNLAKLVAIFGSRRFFPAMPMRVMEGEGGAIRPRRAGVLRNPGLTGAGERYPIASAFKSAANGGCARDEHQGKVLYRRDIRAPDPPGAGQDRADAARRMRQGRARRCRPDEKRHRRVFLRRRRHAGSRRAVDGRLSRPQGAAHRFDRHRRLVLSAAGRACRRGDRGRQMLGRADHAGGPSARRGHGDRHRAARALRADAGIGVRAALRAGDREHVCDVRDAAHARIRHDQRADGLGQGRRLASRAIQPACDAAATS